MARNCSSCGKDSPDVSTYCNYCGKPFEIDVICPKCGAKNPSYGVFCGTCGSDLPKVERPPEAPTLAAPPMTQPSVLQGKSLRSCPRCGKPVSFYDFECPHCHMVIVDDSSSATGLYDLPERSSGTSVAAGVLMILTGLMAIGQGVILLMAMGFASDIGAQLPGSITCCGLLDMLFGFGAMFGGYCAITRSSWGLALLGAILAMLSLAFYIGFVLGLIALVLVAVSKEDFHS